MENKSKEQFFEEFNRGLHFLGRIMLILSLVLLFAVPCVIAAINGVSIELNGFLAGFANVGIIYIPIAIVEFLVYSPMLGAGGSYLSFLTGNVTNMKIPCAMNARDIAETEVGTPENEIVSTISVATSAIVTTVVVAVGVLLLYISPLQTLLQHEAIAPMLSIERGIVVASLFGALGLKYFIKSPKIAVLPLLLITLLCIFVPSMINQTSILMIPCGILALGIGFFLFKKGKL